MASKDILSMILQGGATAVGSAFGPAGAAVGAGLGQAVSAGIDMVTDKPEYPGPSADEKMALFFASENAAEASMTDGPSSQSVSRLQEASGKAGMQQANELNTVAIGMSPLDRSRLTTSLLSRSSESRAKGQSALEGFIEGSRGRALVNKVQTTRAYANQAQNVRIAEQNAIVKRQATETAMNDQFSSIMTGLVKSMSNPALNLFQTEEKPEQAPVVEQAETPLLDELGYGQLEPESYGGGFNPGTLMPVSSDSVKPIPTSPAPIKQTSVDDTNPWFNNDNIDPEELFDYMERMFGGDAL